MFSIVIAFGFLPRRAQRDVAATKAGMAHGPGEGNHGEHGGHGGTEEAVDHPIARVPNLGRWPYANDIFPRRLSVHAVVNTPSKNDSAIHDSTTKLRPHAPTNRSGPIHPATSRNGLRIFDKIIGRQNHFLRCLAPPFLFLFVRFGGHLLISVPSEAPPPLDQISATLESPQKGTKNHEKYHVLRPHAPTSRPGPTGPATSRSA